MGFTREKQMKSVIENIKPLIQEIALTEMNTQIEAINEKQANKLTETLAAWEKRVRETTQNIIRQEIDKVIEAKVKAVLEQQQQQKG